MDTQPTNTAEHPVAWDAGGQESYESSSEKISFEPTEDAPLIMADTDSQHGYSSVATAAKIFGKSERQIQRMVKSGELKGMKIQGRRGPQWLIDNASLVGRPVSAQVDIELQQRIRLLESNLETVIAELTTMRQKIEALESDHVSLASTVTTPADLLYKLDESQIEPHTDSIISMSEQESKTSWWHKAFAKK
jgi:Helix-turn-helix domain